jgi:metallophosphoesterase superfamily enzyme
VKAASDLLKHLLMQGFNIKPQTYADTFLQAGRNRLVHDDEAIDPSRVFAAAAGHGHPSANLSRDQGPPPRHDRRRC